MTNKLATIIIVLLTIITFNYSHAQEIPTVKVKIQNCYPHYWVGAVKWNQDHTEYKDVPEFEIKGIGSKDIQLEPGDYAVTVFQPPYTVQYEGKLFNLAPKIIDFIEVTITGPTYLSYGCSEITES